MSAHRTADLGFARLDLDRARRTGTPEVVYAAGKTPEQTVACLAALRDGGSALAWATRVDDVTAAAVLERWPDA
ncbi:MAG: putative 1-(5-Phosphoribosyl)-5-amino-4-imidazole-carboxylate carboxylase, partial [Blastococcus sp.]|nr:putative 1-(5-Phosphoribosyl)-5-amino-4-imidazole-carboxylate carboxylase [Blastococcus sp.]